MVGMYWIYYTCLVVVLLAGLAGIVLSLPGIWVMVLGVVIYGAATKWIYFGWKTVVLIVVLAGVAEVVETSAGGAGAKREGASRGGILGAVVGGIVGGIVFSFLIPIFVLGTVIGLVVGSLFGAMVMELRAGKNLEHSLRIGVGAAKGRLMGMLWKVGFGVLVLIVSVWMALPVGAPALAMKSAPVTQRAATSPAGLTAVEQTTAPASAPTTGPGVNEGR